MASRDINGGVALWSSAAGTQHTSELVRSFQYAMSLGIGGVFGTSDFKVTYSGSDFAVAAGRAMVVRTTGTGAAQGSYFVHNTASISSQTVDTVASGTRTDLIQLKVYDNGYSDGQTQWAIRYLPNTAAGAGDSNAIDLATLTVGTGGITAVTDKRPLLPRPRNLVVANPATDIPIAPEAGTFMWQTNNNYANVYDGSNWQRITTHLSLPAPFYANLTVTDAQNTTFANATVTSPTSVASSSITTAPCPLRMVVQVQGSWGFSYSGKSAYIYISEIASPYNSINVDGDTWGQHIRLTAGAEITALSMMGVKDFAKGDTIGFRVRYAVDSGTNCFIGAGVLATFYPLP